MTLDAAIVDDWLNRYLEAWRSNTADQIGLLFTERATYSYQPWGDPLVGADAIVADWLSEPDEVGSWEADYRCHLVAGDRAIAIGETKYTNGNVFSNLFQLRFEDAQCSEFVDWYMVKPATVDGPGVEVDD